MRLFAPENSVQGWSEFLTARAELLASYDQALAKTKNRPVKVEHGRVGEAQLRKWLESFLPEKYGVTSGFIISHALLDGSPMPHFDVIVYDRLESPVLWYDNNPDLSEGGRSRAIPAEHVLCVLEVKAAFSSKTASEALSHLEELKPYTKPNGGRFRSSLPQNFCCGVVFFDLREDEKRKIKCLDSMVRSDTWLRGYFGGLVLRCAGKTRPETGRIHPTIDEKPATASILGGKSTLGKDATSNAIKVRKNRFAGAYIVWMEAGFAMFAFDLIAIMQGRYHPGKLSSKHGIGAST